MLFVTALLLGFLASTSAAPSRPAAVVPPRATRPSIGQPPPSFTLRDQNGRRVGLAEAAGRKAVLVFYRGYW